MYNAKNGQCVIMRSIIFKHHFNVNIKSTSFKSNDDRRLRTCQNLMPIATCLQDCGIIDDVFTKTLFVCHIHYVFTFSLYLNLRNIHSGYQMWSRAIFETESVTETRMP